MKNKNNISAFRESVYKALKQIPKGKVTTYKALADHLNCGSPRAVGQALKNNPFAPKIPCHRVISSNMTIGGFCGKTEGREINRKIKLLASEGVSFKNNKLTDKNRLFTFP